MGKVTGFMEYERIEEGYKPPQERLKHYKEFVVGLTPEQAARGGAAGAAQQEEATAHWARRCCARLSGRGLSPWLNAIG